MTRVPLKAVSLITLAFGLVGCPSPWTYPTLAFGNLSGQTLEVAETETIRVTATVPAQALPGELKDGWNSEIEFDFDGWTERDDVRMHFSDCDGFEYGTAESPVDSYNGGMGLNAAVFDDCAPDEDCVRELCVDIEVLTARTVEINWEVDAQIRDATAYHMHNREGQKQLEAHPVQEPFEIQLDVELL